MSKTSKCSEVIFDLAGKTGEIGKSEEQSAAPDFWDDATEAQKILKRLNRLKVTIGPLKDLMARTEDVKVLAELVEDEESDEAQDLLRDIEQIEKDYDKLELETYLSGEHDSSGAILEINAGAGGTEACDWADMLLRMYLRWAERRGWKTEVLNTVPGDVAGIKSATVTVDGHNAYGYLRNEKGVHRLVRISPFDANKRRHTSFAAVDAIPDLDEDDSVDINPDEVKMDTYRASGAGGQHVNKTDSAVRLTHIPSGIVVTCQNERSQHKNREAAMKILAARLAEMQRAENEQRLNELRGDLRAIEWGSQMRSYVFQPYTLVKDHRTGHETGDVIRIMDGDIDDFINASLKHLPQNETAG